MSTASTRSMPAHFSDFADSGEGRPLVGFAKNAAWITFGVLLAAIASAYFNMLEYTATYWVKGLYSHGWIVPLIAAYLFWLRSHAEVKFSTKELAIGGALVGGCALAHLVNVGNNGVLSKSLPLFDFWFPHLEMWLGIGMFVYAMRKAQVVEVSPMERWIGVAILAVCLLVRVWAAKYDVNNPERASFIGALLAVTLIVGGRRMLWWAGPALAFLAFMFPLPAIIENTLLMKLQLIATIVSTLTLQMLGIAATREGNSIAIDTLKEPLLVAEACSGLRMLTIFGAMTVALVMIIERPWWDRLVIFLSWVPIALISNMVRIVLTALLYVIFGQENPWLSGIIHDWAGLSMIFIGMGLLGLELAVLQRLTIPVEEDFSTLSAAPA